MASTSVQVFIPFESLLDSVKKLNTTEKRRLLEILEEQLGQCEEEQLERDSTIRDQIAEARAAYKAGDYQTLDEHIAKRRLKYHLKKSVQPWLCQGFCDSDVLHIEAICMQRQSRCRNVHVNPVKEWT